MRPHDEDRIRRHAYEIWEREGRPMGRHDEHWRMAEEELAREERRLDTQTVPAARVAKPAAEDMPREQVSVDVAREQAPIEPREQTPIETQPETTTEASRSAAPTPPSATETVPPVAPQAEPLGLTGQKVAQEAIAKEKSRAGPKRRRTTKGRSRARKSSNTPQTPDS